VDDDCRDSSTIAYASSSSSSFIEPSWDTSSSVEASDSKDSCPSWSFFVDVDGLYVVVIVGRLLLLFDSS